MLLVIDNYDSFVHNLARYMTRLGWDTEVIRNDAINIQDIETLKPTAILISPGPCSPDEAGISIETVKAYGPHIPILGVCLGHQAIAQAYGGRTIKGPAYHGKPSTITHTGHVLFQNIPSPCTVGRYHSLIVDIENTPLIPIAETPEKVPEKMPEKTLEKTQEGEQNTRPINMAFAHPVHPVYGVQFHPESILTPDGATILENFTALAHAWHARTQQAA